MKAKATLVRLSAGLLLITAGLPLTSAQSSSGGKSSGDSTSSGSSTSQPSVGSQTYSIEGNILGYKALQSDGEAIACDAAFALPGGSAAVMSNSAGTVQTACAAAPDLSSAHVLVLPSLDQTVANYQLWRLAIATTDTLTKAANSLVPISAQGDGRSFTGVETAISSTLAIIQTIGSFFATNEAVAGIQGTPQDIALVDIVSRQLRVMGAHVYAPNTFSPFALSGVDYTNSPFLARLQAVQIIRGQLVAALADKVQLDTNTQTITADQAQIQALNDQDDANKKTGKPAANGPKVAALSAEIAAKTQESLQLKANYTGDSLTKVSNAKIISMIQTIDSFTLSLINTGTNTSTPTSATAQNTASSGTATADPNSGKGSAAGANGSSSSNAQTQATTNTTIPALPSLPPLVSILYADGIARALGATRDNLVPDTSTWRIISLKELEMGSSVVARSRFLGTKIIYAGGAAATYAVMGFDGALYCSATVFDYGGRIDGKSFEKKFRKADLDPSAQLLFSRGRCKPAQ